MKVGRLPKLLQNRLLDAFVKSLHFLHHPHLRWMEGIIEVCMHACMHASCTSSRPSCTLLLQFIFSFAFFLSNLPGQESCRGKATPKGGGPLHSIAAQLLQCKPPSDRVQGRVAQSPLGFDFVETRQESVRSDRAQCPLSAWWRGWRDAQGDGTDPEEVFAVTNGGTEIGAKGPRTQRRSHVALINTKSTCSHLKSVSHIYILCRFHLICVVMAGHGRPPLSMFSEWLHEFDGTERSASTGLHIDMPGWISKGAQVDGLVEASVHIFLSLNLHFRFGRARIHAQLAPRVESFDDKLLTMASKQKPKRLKIRGWGGARLLRPALL